MSTWKQGLKVYIVIQSLKIRRKQEITYFGPNFVFLTSRKYYIILVYHDMKYQPKPMTQSRETQQIPLTKIRLFYLMQKVEKLIIKSKRTFVLYWI